MIITRKTRLIIIGLVIVIFLLLLFWIWILLQPKVSQQQVIIETPAPVEEVIVDPGPSPQQQLQTQEQDSRQQASSITTVAKTFIERYGSYSNEAQFQNLVDLLPFMTETFAKQTQVFIETSTLPETYYGVTTRLLTITVDELDETEGVASLRAQTQRSIAEGSPQNLINSYQEIRLEMRRESGLWKVNAADWL